MSAFEDRALRDAVASCSRGTVLAVAEQLRKVPGRLPGVRIVGGGFVSDDRFGEQALCNALAAFLEAL